MNEGSKAPEAPNAQGGKARAAPCDEVKSDADVDSLTLSLRHQKITDRVDPGNQIVHCGAFKFERELPEYVKPFEIEGVNFLLITTPLLTEGLLKQLVVKWGPKAADELTTEAVKRCVLAECIGREVKSIAESFAALSNGKLLRNQQKFATMVQAYELLGIPYLNEAAGKAAGDGVAVAKLDKKAESAKVKGGRGETKATTKLPKASDGLVGTKAADGSVGAIVAIDAVATAVDNAKAVLSAAREIKRANKKFTKAVFAASVGEGKAAVSCGGTSSGKEAKSNAAAGGGAAFSGKEAKGLGGGAVVQGGKSKVVETAPSAAGSARPTKRRSPEANE